MNNLTAISEKLAEEIEKHLVENQATISLSEIERTSRELLQEIGRQAIGDSQGDPRARNSLSRTNHV